MSSKSALEGERKQVTVLWHPKAARGLGVAIPQSILLRPAEVTEEDA